MTLLPQNPTLTASANFTTETNPSAVKMRSEKIQALADLFQHQVTNGQHPGAQLVLMRHGRVILNRVAGLAHVRRRIPITPATLFLTLSITKSLVSMCAHHLIETGKLEWDAPIATYWPEFGCKGKQTATIRHLFRHQTGVPWMGRRMYKHLLHFFNWQRMIRQLAQSPAEYPPGSKTTYHMLNYGFILGEIVRRVSGKSIDMYLRDVFLEPLGLRDTFLGLSPAERPRLARVYTDRDRLRTETYGGYATHWYLGPLVNLWPVRRLMLPSSNLHSTARDLAVFFQMLLNGGLYAGRHYLQPATIQAATALGYDGYDHVVKLPIRWAHGFTLGGHGVDWGTPGVYGGTGKGSSVCTYGGFGLATSMAWADPDADIVMVFLCNRMLPDIANRKRMAALSNLVWDAIIDHRAE